MELDIQSPKNESCGVVVDKTPEIAQAARMVRIDLHFKKRLKAVLFRFT